MSRIPKPVRQTFSNNKRKIKISVIICTEAENRLEKVKSGLKSLTRQKFKEFQIIIVDARNDDLLFKVCKNYSKRLSIVRIKIFKRNLAYSRNIGIKNSNTSIVSFMDDDARADSGWLKVINSDFSIHKDVVGLAGKILTDKKSIVSRFSEKLFDYGDVPREINTITGANMSFNVKRVKNLKSYNRKNIFDENFNFAGEETDACFYIRSKDGKLLFDPNIVVWHDFPDNLKTFFKKHFLYGGGDYVVMSKVEYKAFSLIDDYKKAISVSKLRCTQILTSRIVKLTKSVGILWLPLATIREIAYFFGLYSSFLKGLHELK